MAFIRVPEVDDRLGGNFSIDRRKFFNWCGSNHYLGSISFNDANHRRKVVPLFSDECLEEKRETFKLLKQLRKDMKASDVFRLSENGVRSIHQNENGYLPYKDDGGADKSSVAAPLIRNTALLLGKLPNNQASVGARTQGQFLEYTCGDAMHVDSRLIVDYRFGIIYMTFGHYHRDSFALLVRSTAELRFELQPIFSVLNATFDG